MKCIVGLGNPGSEYESTRHNVGFRVIDRLASLLVVSVNREKFRALYGEAKVAGEKVFLVKPQTYMNLSGEAVRELVDYFHIDLSDVIVVYDDMDLPLGSLRLRETGSAGFHNGMKSILSCLGTNQIKRVRIGVGAHGEIAAADYVLGKFKKEEREVVSKTCDKAANAIMESLTKPFNQVMTEYNEKPRDNG